MNSKTLHRVIVAAGFSLCPVFVAAAQTRPASNPSVNPPTAAARPQATTELPDSNLVKRWSELFANLIGEFKREGRDPKGIIRGDFSSREISILTDPESEKSWVGMAVSNRVLLNGDLRAVATELYHAWKAAADTI